MKRLITDYRDALKQQRKLNKEEGRANDLYETLGSKNWTKYNDLKMHLEEEERKARDIIEENHESAQEKLKERREPYRKIIQQVKRIISLIGIAREKYNTDFEVYIYSDKDEGGNYLTEKRKIFLTPYEILADDEFKKIAVYITENNKPKNKYSIIIIGKSIFGYSENLGLLDFRYYGVQCNNTGNIARTLKDLPTVEELKGWYSRNKNKLTLLNEYLAKHTEVEAEYMKAKLLYKSKKWKIVYLEKRKDYYESQYSRGIETAEYKKIVRQLKKLKEGKK